MTYKSTPKGLAITSMNILDGLQHQAHWDDLQPVWEAEGMGFIEFCNYIAEVAGVSEKWLEQHEVQDFPGVYDYEVSYAVGKRLLGYALETKKLPSLEEVAGWINEAAGEFFANGQGGPWPEQEVAV